MNYLAHHFFYATSDPWYNTGLILPDLSRKMPGRRKLHEPGKRTPEHIALSMGCEKHYETDAWFHDSHYFVTMNEYLSMELQTFQERGFLVDQRKWFLAHLLSEMILDRLITDNHPGALDHFYSDLNAVDEHRVLSFLLDAGKTVAGNFMEMYRRFCESEFIRHYRENRGLVQSLDRVIRRSGQPAFSVPEEDLLCFQLDRWIERAAQIKKPSEMGRL